MANHPMHYADAAAAAGAGGGAGSPAIPIRRTDSAGSGGPGLGAVSGGGAIAIPNSYRDDDDDYRDRRRGGGRRDDCSSDGESDGGGGVRRDDFLSGSYMGGDSLDARDGTAAVIVGSLPSSRYERRRAAAAATSRAGSIGGGGTAGGELAQSLGLGGAEGSLARSLPPPRAPWLHAQKSEDPMSRVPQMALPESATEGMVPSSLPYGSLRESRFGHYHQRGRHPPPGGGPQRHVRFAGDSSARGGMKAAVDGEDPHDAGGTTVVGGGLYPSSLPAYTDAGSEMARRRWEKEVVAAAASPDVIMGGSSPSPLALGIGGGIGSAVGSSPVVGSSGGSGGGGIGAAIGDSPPVGAASSTSVMGSLTAQMSGLAPPSAGGIGEAVEGSIGASTAAVRLEDNSGAYNGEDIGGYGSGVLYGDRGENCEGVDEHLDGNGSSSRLSSSLTALNILESARTSQEGLGAALSPQEVQSARAAATMGSDMVGTATVTAGNVHVPLDATAVPLHTASGVANAYGADLHRDGGGRVLEDTDHFEAFDLELED